MPWTNGNQAISKQAAAASDLKIEGIIYDPPQGSLVLINGEFFKPGEKFGDATVISIFQDHVIFSQTDEEKTIWIREEIIPEGEKKDESAEDLQTQKS